MNHSRDMLVFEEEGVGNAANIKDYPRREEDFVILLLM